MSSRKRLLPRISGFVIVGEDNTGKLDLGIFIASVVPDGPADKDGRIKPGTTYQNLLKKGSYLCSLALQTPSTGLTLSFSLRFAGGRLISLNKISLEGVTFTDAAAILQSSPDEVELIVSQPKREIFNFPFVLSSSGCTQINTRAFYLRVSEGQ